MSLMGRKAKLHSNALTAFEQKVMAVVWRLGSATVNDVLSELNKDQDFAYTTVSTMMRVLETKGILESVKNGKSHIYVPLLEKETYESHALNLLLKDLFADQPGLLLEKMITDDLLTPADLAEAKLLIEQAMSRK